MKKGAFYSSSSRARTRLKPGQTDPFMEPEPPPPPSRLKVFWNTRIARHEKKLMAATGALSAIVVLVLYTLLIPGARQYTQHDIDLAVRSTLESLPPEPSRAAMAYEVIRPSVVRVNQLEKEKDSEEVTIKGVGTGVIIDDQGVILTNLHVV